jgi:hypothetical protein
MASELLRLARLDNESTLTHATQLGRREMAMYTCEVCGMSVGTMTCGTCNKELAHDVITTDSGEKIAVSKCPDNHGMIKSPTCCGQDMRRDG